MNIDKVINYTLHINEAKYTLPYMIVRYKVIQFNRLKTCEKLIKQYKELNIPYKSDKKNRIVYRVLLKEHLPFTEKVRLIETLLGAGWEDYVNDSNNWYKNKNKRVLSCMANYLLKGEERQSDVLTNRQIRYINEKEIDIDFEDFQESLVG